MIMIEVIFAMIDVDDDDGYDDDKDDKDDDDYTVFPWCFLRSSIKW